MFAPCTVVRPVALLSVLMFVLCQHWLALLTGCRPATVAVAQHVLSCGRLYTCVNIDSSTGW